MDILGALWSVVRIFFHSSLMQGWAISAKKKLHAYIYR